MKKIMKTLTALALCLCLVCGLLAAPAQAALPDSTRLGQLIDGAVGYGKGAQSDLVNAESLKTLADLDWWVFGAARAGVSADYRTYLAAVSTYLEENSGQSATDLERMFLAVKAAGGDPVAIGGRNLLKELEQADMSAVNAAIFGLLCLGSVDYTPSAGAGNTPQSLIAALDTLQAADGSFGFTYDGVTYVDAGLTAQAVTALAPYYSTNATAKAVADKALAYLSGIQQADGSFASWGAVDSAAVAETVVALCALGKDPSTEAAFQKATGGLTDALLSLCDASGAYDTGAYDVKMSTRTGLMAFAALKRFSGSENGLYNLRDAQPLQAGMTLGELQTAVAAVEAAPTLDNKVTVSSLLLELSLVPANDAVKADLQNRLNAVKAEILTVQKTVKALDKDIWDQIDPMNVTLKDRDTVAALMARYRALADADKLHVENRQDLLDAAVKIAELEKAAGNGAPATGSRSETLLYGALVLLGLCGAVAVRKKVF